MWTGMHWGSYWVHQTDLSCSNGLLGPFHCFMFPNSLTLLSLMCHHAACCLSAAEWGTTARQAISTQSRQQELSFLLWSQIFSISHSQTKDTDKRDQTKNNFLCTSLLGVSHYSDSIKWLREIPKELITLQGDLQTNGARWVVKFSLDCEYACLSQRVWFSLITLTLEIHCRIQLVLPVPLRAGRLNI